MKRTKLGVLSLIAAGALVACGDSTGVDVELSDAEAAALAEAVIQAAVFATTSVVLLFGLRRYVKKWFVGKIADPNGASDDDFTGREARVVSELPGRGADGLVEIKGANWKARSDAPIAAGETVIIERREGLTFHVRPRH